MLEVLVYGTLLFVLFSILLFPLGHLVLEKFFKNLSPWLKLVAAFGLSAFLYSALVVLLVLTPFGNTAIASVLWVLVVLSFYLWLKDKHFQLLSCSHVIFGVIVWFGYYLLCVCGASFPAGEIDSLSAASVMSLTGLPIDNLISYNFSRYLVGRFDPKLLEVVPNWAATERGPMSGILNAFVFLFLGLEDKGHWLSSAPGLFFVYEALLVYLNSLVVLCIWALSCLYFGPRSAVFAAMLLMSTSYLYVNVLFSWPKFFMCFYALVALSVWQKHRLGFLSGVFLGCALLNHNSIVFALLSFGVVVLFSQFYRAESRAKNLKALVLLALGFFVVLSPWLFYKASYADNSPRLLYLHLFCNKDQDADRLSFREAASRYLEKTSAPKIISTRIENILYPFNVFHPREEFIKYFSKPYRLMASISNLSFYQLVYALGIPFFALFIAAWFRLARDKALRPMLFWLLVCYGAVIPAGLFFACPLASWNHIWAYPAFAFSALPAGRVVASAGRWARVLFALSLALGILAALFNVYFGEPSGAYIHCSREYVQMMFVIAWVLFSFCFVGLYAFRLAEDET